MVVSNDLDGRTHGDQIGSGARTGLTGEIGVVRAQRREILVATLFAIVARI